MSSKELQTTPRVFPEVFGDLEPFSSWALATEQERMAARDSSTIEELQVFYDVMLPRIPAIVAYLDQFPLDRLPDDTRSLLNLALSAIEASIAVELYHQPQVINGFDRARFRPVE
jgi:hypothetical protein